MKRSGAVLLLTLLISQSVGLPASAEPWLELDGAAPASLPAEPVPAWAKVPCATFETWPKCGFNPGCILCLAAELYVDNQKLSEQKDALAQHSVELADLLAETEGKRREAVDNGKSAVKLARDIGVKLMSASVRLATMENNALSALPWYYHPAFVATTAVAATLAVCLAIAKVAVSVVAASMR